MRVFGDAGIATGRGWTLLRHFRLLGPIARLPSGVRSGSGARTLVSSVVRSLRFTPRRGRARRAAVLLPAVASAADRRQRVAAPAVEQASAGLRVFVRAAADGWPPRPAENWTSPLGSAMTPETSGSTSLVWALLEGRGVQPGLPHLWAPLLLPTPARFPKNPAPRSVADTSARASDPHALTRARAQTPALSRRHRQRAHPVVEKQRPSSGCVLARREFLLRTEAFITVFNRGLPRLASPWHLW